MQLVLDTLSDFFQASGLKVNFDKSKEMCSSKVPRQIQVELSSISSVRFVRDLGTYLGFPLVQGRTCKNTYNGVVEKIKKRMASWKGRLLNKAGKVCLVKLVTSFVPI